MPFNRLNHSILGEIRPRFKLKSSLGPDEVFEKIKAHIEKDKTITGRVVDHYAIIGIPGEDIHYWSPELQIRAEVDEENPEFSIVRCLVGPRQTVWAMFSFFYAAIIIVSTFGGMYGLSRIQLGHSSNFVWFFPIGLLVFSSIYLTAKLGQKSGRDQMLHLVSFVYHTLDDHGSVERVE